jgi:hypothetical protein
MVGDHFLLLYPNCLNSELIDAAHVLPVLFSFTTPGKFCYRAIASFCKHVTGMKNTPIPLSPSLSTSNFQRPEMRPLRTISGILSKETKTARASTLSNSPLGHPQANRSVSTPMLHQEASLKRSVSVTFSRATSSLLRNGRQRSRSLKSSESSKSSDIGNLEPVPPLPNGLPSTSSLNIASVTTEEPMALEDREAGDPIVYSETPVSCFILDDR